MKGTTISRVSVFKTLRLGGVGGVHMHVSSDGGGGSHRPMVCAHRINTHMMRICDT